MADTTKCNKCNRQIKYIYTRKEGEIPCEPNMVKTVQKSGRIVEAYLIHDCNNRTPEEISQEKDAAEKLWVGPDPL